MSNAIDTTSAKLSYCKAAKSAADKPASPTLDEAASAAAPRTRAISSDSKKLISDLLKSSPVSAASTGSLLSHIKFEPGCTVNVVLKDGLQYKGVCGNAVTITKASSSVTLLNAKRVESLAKSVDVNGGQMVIKLADIASLVDMASLAETVPPKVDRVVLSSPKSFERDLKRWQPESSADMLLEIESPKSPTSSSTAWDQFAVNERLFGVRTDFDEELYTTKLDKHSPDFRRREREAHKIAMEIQRAFTSNPHMSEERGQHTQQDVGLDEEDKYGAVLRRQPGSYVPPALRKRAELEGTHEDKAATKREPAMDLNGKEPAAKEEPLAATAEPQPARLALALSLKEGTTACASVAAAAQPSVTTSTPALLAPGNGEKKSPSFKLNPNATEFKPKAFVAAPASLVHGASYAMPPMIPYMTGYAMPGYGYPPVMPGPGVPPHAYYYSSYPSYTAHAGGAPYYGNGPIFRPSHRNND